MAVKRTLRAEGIVAAPERRVVLLGASNLTKGISTVLETASRLWGRPLAVFGALGHGRSYGRTSSILGRQLPGILECGLWDDLARWPTVPTAALVTDIGNDLLYEAAVADIAAWVRACLDRLAAIDARTVVTLLPVENIAGLSHARFKFMRTIFFPHSRITLAEVSRRAFELNDWVRRMAAERGFATVPHRPVWYGFDPIHIRLRHRSAALARNPGQLVALGGHRTGAGHRVADALSALANAGKTAFPGFRAARPSARRPHARRHDRRRLLSTALLDAERQCFAAHARPSRLLAPGCHSF